MDLDHEDPVGVMDTIVEAKEIAAQAFAAWILGYVLGADLVTPSLKKQCQMLTDAGVIWASVAPTRITGT